LAQITTQIVSGQSYFWTASFYRKSETHLASTGDRPITVPNMG